MFRTLARATRALRTPAQPFILPGAYLHPSPHSPPSIQYPSAPSTGTTQDVRAARVAYFMWCAFIGPVMANRLVANGCHSFRDALDRDGKPGSRIRLNVHQRYHVQQEAWHDEWVEKKRRTDEREAL